MNRFDRSSRGRAAWLLVALVVLLAGAGASGYALSGGSSAASGATGSSGPAPASSPAGGAAAPATPTITAKPADPTLLTTATFTYSERVAAATFVCSLDGSAFTACGGGAPKPPNTGSITYTSLLPQQHCFSVQAVLAVLTSAPAVSCWQQNGVPFSMSWTPAGPFYPAAGQRADLIISNPNGKAITIPKTGDTGGLQVVVSSNDPVHCPSSNFGLIHGLTVAVTVPAHTSGSTLTALGVANGDQPVVTMFDGSGGPGSHTDQDLCQRVGLTFTFTAVATGI